MITRFNYTGRKRILREHFKVVVNSSTDETDQFEIKKLSLDNYEFDSAANVHIEFFRGPENYQRFELGTVGQLIDPDSTALTEIPSIGVYTFKIKVTDTDPSNQNKLLGVSSATPIRMLDESGKGNTGIINLHSTSSINGIWNLNLSDDGPLLEINTDVHNNISNHVKGQTDFRALIYPQVTSDVLNYINHPENGHLREGDGNYEWVDNWMTFGTMLAGPPPDNEITEEWILNVVTELIYKHNFKEIYKQVIDKNR